MEIASDFSVLHRVDDPMSLPSSRYFEFAELLASYQGAVRVALIRAAQAEQTEPVDPALEDTVSPAALAAMASDRSLPWIEHTGG